MTGGAAGTEQLHGLRILVTRPAHQAEPICAKIESCGGRVLRLPLIAIQWLEPPALTLDEGGWLIFTSANAVEGLLRSSRVPAQVLSSPDVRVIAIGPATRRRLQAAGVPVHWSPASQFTSEALLEQLGEAGPAGRDVVVVKGVGGRQTLEEHLRDRGARVRTLTVYRREPVRIHPPAVNEAVERAGVDAALVTSGEILTALDDYLAAHNAALKATLALVAGGQRVARLAQQRSFERVVAAPDPSDASMFEALVALAGTLHRG